MKAWIDAPLRLPPPLLHFTVYGVAHPAGSKTTYRFKTTSGKTVSNTTHDNERTRPWMDQVQQAAGRAAEQLGLEVLDGPLYLIVVIHRKRPKSHWKKSGGFAKGATIFPTTAPDLTKLVRAIEDAMTQAGVWRDDSRVVLQLTQKVFEDVDGRPKATVMVGPLDAGFGLRQIVTRAVDI